MKTLRETLDHNKHTLIEALIKTQVRALMKETPGDAQYIELVGSMVKMGRPPSDGVEIDVPITMVGYNYPGDLDEFNSASSHELMIVGEWDSTVWSQSDAEVGQMSGPSVTSPQNWDVIAVDGCEIEPNDAELIKRFIVSRPDIADMVEQRMMAAKEDRELAFGYDDPREDDWERDE